MGLSPLVFGTYCSGGKNTEELGLPWRSFEQVTQLPGPSVLLAECG